jgi:hypothetical protein
VRKVNETAMGIRPSSSSEREKLKLKSILELKLQTLKYVASNTVTTTE